MEEKTPINFPEIKIPPPNKPSDIERERYNALIKYNESFDLFKNLQAITINVWLNKNVEANIKSTVEKVVRGLALTYGEISADVKVSYLEYAVPEVVIEEKPLEWWEWIEKFKLPIGIIIAVIIFGIILYVLLNKYEKMKKEQDAANANAQTPPLPEETEEEEEKTEDGDGGGGAGAGEIEDVTKTSGIERFKSFMINALKDAGLLVKKWIYEEKEISNLALKLLVERLEYEVLLNLFGTLSDADREKWKKILYRYPGKIPDEETVDAYVGVEVVNQVIVTPVVDDHELSDILISIDKEVIIRFMRDKSDLAGILMNVLNTSYIQSSIETFDDEFLREVIALSLMYTKTEVRANVPLLKEELAHYVEVKQEAPFIEKIRELIPGMFRRKEGQFYDALFQSGEGYIAKQIALQTLPSELIPSLPFELLKVVIDQWNIKQQVEFLVALEDKESKFFLELMAPDGTKRREMINLELENYQIDKNLRSLIIQRKDEIWLRYMGEQRTYIHDHPEIKGQVADAIEKWVEEKEELYKHDVAKLRENIAADQQAALDEEQKNAEDQDQDDDNMAAE